MYAMKLVALKLLTYWRFLFYNNVNNNKSSIWKSKVKIKGGKVTLNNCQLNSCDISSTGEGNDIFINGWMYKSNILVNGKKNTVIIGKGCEIVKTRIVVRGNNCKVVIGDNSTSGSAFIVCMGHENYILLGEDCMLAEDIDIWSTDSHPIFDDNGTVINPSKPISIGKHVWIGKGVKILKGVTIGNNAVIGMNTLITKDVEANSLNIGSPSRTIRRNINWDGHFIDQ